ncbi:sulfate/molybdate ABC transporter ATP-binding protein [Clostridium sp. 'White wine YQ']|uniref:sulfate/molybdate ABC transporter ATP-binding protein n=1 Tax=Clostridium sp. 'White wine YQ' TaxID=3027474 RepID=UPI0023662BAD|nr:sulfate/molybdate ABC transporter ATP-binding protein [Clostridium sp. 'White wine YQ']MDD7794816.1 sulfate/molybdate ABC transporter ATP-binding protein [Clostridium sp. 'White wine YQ']
MSLFVDIKKSLPGFNLHVSFESNNHTLGLLGESGCGKSITLKCIAGLMKPDSGKIILNNKILFDSEKGINVPIQKRKIGFLFQNYALFPHMTVEENIAYAMKGYSKTQKKEIINENLNMLKIRNLRTNYPHQLSGGQQQRVALARALAVEPEVLLLDEPFSALDNHLRSIMIKHMTETLSNYSGSTLFVTHNLEEAYALCENLVIISKGRNVSNGDKNEIFKNPSSIAAAKITGCKNLSKAKIISTSTIELTDWECTIKVNKEILPDITHIGIRAHYITLAKENSINSFNVWPSYTCETPFRRMVYLKLHKEPISPNDYNLQWDISTEEWNLIKNKPLPWRISLKEDFLIFIKED